jgi:hypothetical protein
MGAVQGQEYNQSLWGIGLRMREATEARVEEAIADRSIVRTWFMRGTLHFLPADDFRWMIALKSDFMRRFVQSVNKYDKIGLDEALHARTQSALARALEGGHQLMRTEIAEALKREGIEASGIKLSLLLQRAQADSLICYGERRGKQVTFTLLDEWLPPSEALSREEALARFALRYFRSHGPATVQDFATWASLNLTDARFGLEASKAELMSEVRGEQTYWFAPPVPSIEPESPTVHLLPVYDEMVMGYKDRSALFNPAIIEKAGPVFEEAFSPPLLIDGKIAGNWKREVKRKEVAVTVNPLVPLTGAEQQAVAAEVERLGKFVGLPVAHNGTR